MDLEAINRIEQIFSASARELGGESECAVVPSGMQILDFEQFHEQRRRFRGSFATASMAAFAAYVARHGAAETLCFIDADAAAARMYLDIGDGADPGHCAHVAVLTLKRAALYDEVLGIHGRAMSQRDMAEWLEDWRAAISVEGGADLASALRAVRSIDIKASVDTGSEITNLTETRSTLATVAASSKHTLPAAFILTARPYEELSERLLLLDLSVITGDKPMLKLRLRSLGALQESIAEEFATLLRQELPDTVRPIIGTFNP